MSPSDKSRMDKIASIISIIANLVVIVGIVFAFLQIRQSDLFEKRKTAIEVVNQTRSVEFLKAYTRLKTTYVSKKIEDRVSLIDDLNYVMNTYNSLAILYINNLADRCIIKKNVYSGIKEFSPVLDFLQYPTEYRENFKLLVELMEGEDC